MRGVELVLVHGVRHKQRDKQREGREKEKGGHMMRGVELVLVHGVRHKHVALHSAKLLPRRPLQVHVPVRELEIGLGLG